MTIEGANATGTFLFSEKEKHCIDFLMYALEFAFAYKENGETDEEEGGGGGAKGRAVLFDLLRSALLPPLALSLDVLLLRLLPSVRG